MFGLALTPSNIATLGGAQSPLSQLTALVRSLGGYLLMPGRLTWSNEAGTVPAVTDGVIVRIDSLGATAAAAQSTTAACPILRDIGGKKWAEYDGVDDHLITDIPTPSTGYVCVVGRQDEALGAYNCLLGSTPNYLAGVRLVVIPDGTVAFTRADGTSTNNSSTTNTITAGAPFIADAIWSIASSSVRLNGSGQTSQGSRRNTNSSATLFIGASNNGSGGVSAGSYIQGHLGATIIITNVIPTDAQQQRIRQLAAQIYGIPGVL